MSRWRTEVSGSVIHGLLHVSKTDWVKKITSFTLNHDNRAGSVRQLACRGWFLLVSWHSMLHFCFWKLRVKASSLSDFFFFNPNPQHLILSPLVCCLIKKNEKCLARGWRCSFFGWKAATLRSHLQGCCVRVWIWSGVDFDNSYLTSRTCFGPIFRSVLLLVAVGYLHSLLPC